MLHKNQNICVKIPKKLTFHFLVGTEQVVNSETDVLQEILEMGNGKWITGRLDYFGV